MHLPPDWEARSSGGYFPHLAYLKHKPCGFETGFPYNLHGSEPFGEKSARELVYMHQCEPDE
jgi:hypothetical protein